MTKAEIIAELRRSALEDRRNPTKGVAWPAWKQICTLLGSSEHWFSIKPMTQRTFFLLVAHALEDE